MSTEAGLDCFALNELEGSEPPTAQGHFFTEGEQVAIELSVHDAELAVVGRVVDHLGRAVARACTPLRDIPV